MIFKIDFTDVAWNLSVFPPVSLHIGSVLPPGFLSPSESVSDNSVHG